MTASPAQQAAAIAARAAIDAAGDECQISPPGRGSIAVRLRCVGATNRGELAETRLGYRYVEILGLLADIGIAPDAGDVAAALEGAVVYWLGRKLQVREVLGYDRHLYRVRASYE